MNGRTRARTHVVLGLLGVSLSACGETAAPALPWEAVPMPAPVESSDPALHERRVQLGRLLFHDPVLSRDRAVACVTCHGQIWGLSDGLPRSVGLDGVGPAGTGRSGPNVTRRNSPTLWNVAFVENLMWDGRAASLEDQVLLPLHDDKELGRPPEEVVADLRTLDGYVSLFEASFPGSGHSISVAHLTEAIAAFERTLISDDAPYDQYLAGDDGALSEEAIDGMFVFAELGCDDCHVPPLFASERFVDIGLAADADIDDEGRFEVTDLDADRRAFRVPTLRNIRETKPYFHDGRAQELDETLDHGTRAPAAHERPLLLEFLRQALTDKSQEPDRPLEVPSGLEVPLDGYGIPR